MAHKLYSLTLLLCLSISALAQTSDDIGKIVLGVRFEETATKETQFSRAILEDKLVKFASMAGYSSFSDCAFFVSPNVVINSIDVAEGGMKNVYIVRGELYLAIVDAMNGTVYSSNSYDFKGSATKKEKAVKNALLNIDYSNVSSSFSEAKKKILSYYESHIDAYFAQAEASVANGNYDEAITYLMMVPEELTSLHSKAMERAMTVYNRRDEAIRQQMLSEQRNSNNEILTTASSYLAMHQPQEALKILWNYQRGQEDLDKQYESLIKRAEQQVSASEREALRKEERAYQDSRRREDRAWSEYTKDAQHRRNMDKADVAYRKQKLGATERVVHHGISSSERVVHHQLNTEQQRIRALKDVASEYLRNNPNRVDYFRIRF